MRNKVRFLILGAGPAGLTLANCLKDKGEDSFIVLEKESEAGGLCRSVEVDGSPFDIGGGHFLDVRRPLVDEYLFKFMPRDEWDQYNRDSQIVVGENTIHHPMEANIWEMDIDSQIEYLKSIAVAGCNTGEEMPQEFIDWITWKLGKKIADDYMIPYNQKMFGENLNQLGTYWLSKLPDVSFEDTIRSCLTRNAHAKQPGHAQFLYPKKYGYGEVWLRMADSLGDRIEYNKSVVSIDFDTCTIRTSDGEVYESENIITTIPWMEFEEINGMPEDIKATIDSLKYSSVQTVYFDENLDTTAQWIYYPNPELSYHRILVRHNFCPGSKGYWTETNSDRVKEGSSNYKYMNKYAYPLNTIGKPLIMENLLDWAKSKNVHGLGRWGEHSHYNSDVVVELAMKKADELCN